MSIPEQLTRNYSDLVGSSSLNQLYNQVQSRTIKDMATISVSELRSKMKDVVERVKCEEEIEITQNGEVVAVMLHPSRLRQRVRTPSTVAADKLLRDFMEMQRNPPDFGEGISPERAEEMVRDIRAERDGW